MWTRPRSRQYRRDKPDCPFQDLSETKMNEFETKHASGRFYCKLIARICVGQHGQICSVYHVQAIKGQNMENIISPSPSAVKAPWLTSAMSLGMTCCNLQGRWYSRHSQRWSIHSAMKKVPSARSTPSGRSRAGSLCARYWWANWEGFPACKSMLPKSGPEQRKVSMPPGSSRQISTKVWQCQPLGWCWEGDTSVPQQRCLPKWRWLPKWQRHIQLV